MLYYLGKGTKFEKEECKEYKTIEGALRAAAKDEAFVVWDETGKIVGGLTDNVPEGALKPNPDGSVPAFDESGHPIGAVDAATVAAATGSRRRRKPPERAQRPPQTGRTGQSRKRVHRRPKTPEMGRIQSRKSYQRRRAHISGLTWQQATTIRHRIRRESLLFAIPAQNTRHATSRPEHVQSATSMKTERRRTRPTNSVIRRSRTGLTGRPQKNSVKRQTRSA